MRIRIYVEHVREMSAYIDCLASLRSGRLALVLLRLGHERIVPAFIVHFGALVRGESTVYVSI